MSIIDQEIPVFKKEGPSKPVEVKVQQEPVVKKKELKAIRSKPQELASSSVSSKAFVDKKKYFTYAAFVLLLVYSIFVTKLMIRFAGEANGVDDEIAKLQKENESLKNSREKLLLELSSNASSGSKANNDNALEEELRNSKKDKLIEDQKIQIASLEARLNHLELNARDLASGPSKFNQKGESQYTNIYKQFSRTMGNVGGTGYTEVQRELGQGSDKYDKGWVDAHAN